MYYNSINIRVSSTLKIHKLYTMYVLNVNVMQMTQKGAILAIMQHPTKNQNELRFSGRVGSTCSTSGPSHVTLVTRPMIEHEVGQIREVLTTSGTYNAISAIFQLYHGDLFQWWKKPEYPERTTDHGQATGKLYHLQL